MYECEELGMRRKNSKSFNFKIIHITRKRTKYLRNWSKIMKIGQETKKLLKFKGENLGKF